MRVVMLVQNDWKHDSRVVREAECLALGGHVVDVICRRATDKAITEHQNGVTYLCLPQTEVPLSRLPALLRLHFRVMLLETDGAGRHAVTLRSLASWARFMAFAGVGGLLMILIAPALAAFVIARAASRQLRRRLLAAQTRATERLAPSSAARTTFATVSTLVLGMDS